MGILKKLTISVSAAILMLTCVSFAADYEDTLRVGIYYGSGAVDSLGAESSEGFAAGYYSGRTFNPIIVSDEKSVTVSAGVASGSDMWSVSYAECLSAEEAEGKTKELKALGISAFPVLRGGKIYVWGGYFGNNNDALWAAENFAVKGTAVQANADSLKVSDRLGNIICLVCDSGTEIGIAPKDYTNYDKTVSITGAASGSYRGGFAVSFNDSKKMTVVNVLPIEKYLYGVVSREMSASWHVEALKTQAVCARNFALRRINYHKQYGFDVCRTTCCQAYSGTSAEGENVYRAVDETSGELLMYNGEVCQTVYSSSMGSETESVENVWGTPFPYLVSVENPYEDTENVYNGKWQKKLSAERATEIMASKGYNIGQVLEITAVEYTAAGRVLKLRVKGTGGEKIFEREMCRTIFSEATYSQKYTVTRGGLSTYPKLAVTDGKTAATNTINSFVLSGAGVTAASAKVLYATDGTAQKKYEVTTSEGSSDEFVFTGEGWGHGVGMSQYGAKGMAEAGFTYDEILKHYYTGTELVRVY